MCSSLRAKGWIIIEFMNCFKSWLRTFIRNRNKERSSTFTIGSNLSVFTAHVCNGLLCLRFHKKKVHAAFQKRSRKCDACQDAQAVPFSMNDSPALLLRAAQSGCGCGNRCDSCSHTRTCELSVKGNRKQISSKVDLWPIVTSKNSCLRKMNVVLFISSGFTKSAPDMPLDAIIKADFNSDLIRQLGTALFRSVTESCILIESQARSLTTVVTCWQVGPECCSCPWFFLISSSKCKALDEKTPHIVYEWRGCWWLVTACTSAVISSAQRKHSGNNNTYQHLITTENKTVNYVGKAIIWGHIYGMYFKTASIFFF